MFKTAEPYQEAGCEPFIQGMLANKRLTNVDFTLGSLNIRLSLILKSTYLNFFVRGIYNAHFCF